MNDKIQATVTGLTTLADDCKYVAGWLTEHADEIPADAYPTFRTKYGTGEPGAAVDVMCENAEDLAAMTRLLAKGAPVGGVQKDPSGAYFEVFRMFGSIRVQAWVSRSEVCERVVTGTETVVKTVVNCVHCGGGIYQAGDDEWLHVGGLEVCDPDAGDLGAIASPPDFGAVEVEEVEQVEWVCLPILSEAG